MTENFHVSSCCRTLPIHSQKAKDSSNNNRCHTDHIFPRKTSVENVNSFWGKTAFVAQELLTDWSLDGGFLHKLEEHRFGKLFPLL